MLKPYIQSAENILSILPTFGLLWLQISDTYRNLKHKVGKKGQITPKIKFLNNLEFVNLVIQC